MNKSETIVPDCYLYQIDQYKDRRGFFSELFKVGRYDGFTPLQANWSFSVKNVIRGIHIVPFAKLVTCVQGRILDVCVDMRQDSPTYLAYALRELSPENGHQLFIPAHCGHAFMALEESTIVYFQDGVYNPGVERTVHPLDPKVHIPWPKTDEVIISDKDLSGERL
jgi:dTDP-4-dehydrorhamnose 3,5-epimerase